MENGRNNGVHVCTAQRSTAHATRTGDGDGHRGRRAGEKGTGTRGVRMVCLCGVSETALRFRTQLRFHTADATGGLLAGWQRAGGSTLRRFGGLDRGSEGWADYLRPDQPRTEVRPLVVEVAADDLVLLLHCVVTLGIPVHRGVVVRVVVWLGLVASAEGDQEVSGGGRRHPSRLPAGHLLAMHGVPRRHQFHELLLLLLEVQVDDVTSHARPQQHVLVQHGEGAGQRMQAWS